MRDAYNRFGHEGIKFDPRRDEMKLVADIFIEYLFWGTVAYVFTIPVGARASRIWITIMAIVLLAIEVFLLFTEATIPNWLPPSMTEYELIFYLHGLFPAIIAVLRALSESLYVDIYQTSFLVLKEVYEHQKV